MVMTERSAPHKSDTETSCRPSDPRRTNTYPSPYRSSAKLTSAIWRATLTATVNTRDANGCRKCGGERSSLLGQKIPAQADIFEINRRLCRRKTGTACGAEKPTAAPSLFPTISSFHDRLHLLNCSSSYEVVRRGRRCLAAPASPALAKGHAFAPRLRACYVSGRLPSPTSAAEDAIDNHPVAFAQVLPAMFRLLAEDDGIDETHFFLGSSPCLRWTRRQAKARDRRPAGAYTAVQDSGQISDQNDFIEPPTVAPCAAGAGRGAWASRLCPISP